MLSFQDENLKWASLLVNLLLWSVLPALISGLAAAEKRSHDEPKLVNDCFVAAQFGLVGFYSTLLVAAELREREKNELFALIGLAILLATIELLFTRSIPKRIQKVAPHVCDNTCDIELTFRAKWAIYGSNLILCALSIAIAIWVAFSPLVVKRKNQAETMGAPTTMTAPANMRQ